VILKGTGLSSLDVRPLVHCDDSFDLGDFLSQDPFDAHFHCHRSAGAALAGALQADPHGVILVYADQLNIAAVALKSLAKGFNSIFDLFFQALFNAVIAAAASVTHKKSPKSFPTVALYKTSSRIAIAVSEINSTFVPCKSQPSRSPSTHNFRAPKVLQAMLPPMPDDCSRENRKLADD
jgi:hypothetical protein